MMKVTNAAELKQWLDAGEAVVVDVREDSEWAEGHIAGAVHIPLATVKFDALPVFAGKKLVMQCRSGGRSGKACQILQQQKPDLDVYNLAGGIMGWQQAGLPVTV
ncbi:MAG: rhodanese-like domain-containing protein [Alphaproteobacteria bacterium]|nr:rhodanese-like domain-containing protein [Alphaproteobacteria bacterium]